MDYRLTILFLPFLFGPNLKVLLVSLLFLCVYGFWGRRPRRFWPRRPGRYDVFLSFRGSDNRTGFTDCLYNDLGAAGFCVFKDDRALPIGERIEKGLIQGIRSSRIAIPIISEQYAWSSSCLRELTEIMNCHRDHNISVFPVFYRVDAQDLDAPTGGFADALLKHKATCGDQVPKWKEALTSVRWIRGWTSQEIANGHDGELVKIVVERVSSELKTVWIERLPIFHMLMSVYHIRSAYGYFSEKIRGEVFLSFHCPDTRLSFAACLYNSLVDAGIRVLKDDDPRLIGTHLAHGIVNAICHCKISIPILSANYASSESCLEELAQMVNCKKIKGQKLLPIFYKVKPSQVTKKTSLFRRPMRKLKKKVQPGDYETWNQALAEVGSFSGWESEEIANGDDGRLVKKVVEEVWKLLTNPREHGTHPHPSNN